MTLAEPTVTSLNISKIRVDGGTQPRSELNAEVVAEYAEAIRAGANFPPATVFHDGTDYWLADGFHRRAAYEAAEKSKMPCDVHQGTRRDAVLHSVGANSTHGLPRTNLDKRRAAMTLLKDPEWVKWSDKEISRRCFVSQPFVSQLRSSLITVISETPSSRTFTTKHGTTATMSTSNIGHRPASAPAPKRIDTSTSQDVQDDESDVAIEDEPEETADEPIHNEIIKHTSASNGERISVDVRRREQPDRAAVPEESEDAALNLSLKFNRTNGNLRLYFGSLSTDQIKSLAIILHPGEREDYVKQLKQYAKTLEEWIETLE